ncbi:hypothetical protein SY2F82_74970 [Streptomyces sp. Y2F8-2]|uniref:winged helix-turn-helix transcriptional regulator n=1 Tax=unclassified Streptomyces TaxID=2593676 RepID=UPI0019056544|nr:hypothetical protein SY2F82_74970 [Streptomyces sp. Y2F8-2]
MVCRHAAADPRLPLPRLVGASPPSVEYRLTEEGRSLVPVLEALYAWGEQRAARTGVRIAPPE